MAVKRTKKRVEPEQIEEFDATPMTFEEKPKRNMKKWMWVLVIALLLVGWWWKTRTWPVVAVVEGKPLTRFEVDQALYKQGGENMVESLVTQRLLEAELDRKKVVVDKSVVDGQIEEMRATLPEGRTLEEELDSRGYSLDQIRKLIELQMRINKAVEGEASVSAQDIDQYVTDNKDYMAATTEAERKIEAENILKQDKMQSAIETWVGEVKSKANVWYWPWN